MTLRLLSACAEPVFLRRFHAAATVAWTVMMPVAMLTGLRHSVPFLVGVSVYALMIGHWSSWQAVRVEVRQQDGAG